MDRFDLVCGRLTKEELQTILYEPRVVCKNESSVVLPVYTQNGHVKDFDLPEGRYTGFLENGKPQGEGRMVYRKDYSISNFKFETYEGGFHHGNVSGKGKYITNGLALEGQIINGQLEGIVQINFYRRRRSCHETSNITSVLQIEARAFPVLDNRGRIFYLQHPFLRDFEGTFQFRLFPSPWNVQEQDVLTTLDVIIPFWSQVLPKTGVMQCVDGIIMNGTINIDQSMSQVSCVGVVTHPDGKSVEGTFLVKSKRELKALFS